MMKNRLTLTKVGTDVSEKWFDAYVSPHYWNGWTIPYFTFDVMMDLVEEYSDLVYYDLETDSVIEHFNPDHAQSPEDVDRFKGEFNEEVGEKLYPVGSGAWVWVDIRDSSYKEEEV